MYNWNNESFTEMAIILNEEDYCKINFGETKIFDGFKTVFYNFIVLPNTETFLLEAFSPLITVSSVRLDIENYSFCEEPEKICDFALALYKEHVSNLKEELTEGVKRCLEDEGEWEKEIEDILDDDEKVDSYYLGSYMSLDPCGKYHCILSNNDMTAECNLYWETLEQVAEELDCWITSGENDPTDIFLMKFSK